MAKKLTNEENEKSTLYDLEYVKKYADQVVLLDKTVRIQGTAKKVFESEVYAEVFGRG